MWEKISKEMALPWRAAEAMHWQIGEIEMANRANVPVFHLAGQQSTSSSSAISEGRGSTSPSSVSGAVGPPPTSAFAYPHNHPLPQLGLPYPPPISPEQLRLARSSSSESSPVGINLLRHRADSARSVPTSSTYRPPTLPPLGDMTMPQPRYTLPPVVTSAEAARRS